MTKTKESCHALRMRMCGRGVSNGWGKMGGGKQITKAVRCCECQCSIVLNATRYTIMASSYIDAVRKQKKAEYAKQYRLKRKLLMQQHASTSSEIKLLEKRKKADYSKQKVNVY